MRQYHRGPQENDNYEIVLHRDAFFTAGVAEIPTRLSSVKHICLSGIRLHYLDEVSCELCLIRSFPFLQYMEIEVVYYDNSNDDPPSLESLEEEGFSDVIFSHLREVKLKRYLRTKRGMRLIKLILAKSPVLIRILINPLYVESGAFKTLAKLSKFQQASPKAKVVYDMDGSFD
ncbi:putative protease 2-like [Capsicum annuum]|nr:putative protease 2-like [Capsicum annuum]KAF3644704.1 putative protease 2-like [Capsicum annuum]